MLLLYRNKDRTNNTRRGSGELFRVLLRLLRVDEAPAHHFNSVAHFETGVFIPSTMESASPGNEFR